MVASVEKNLPYSHPQELCYSIIKNNVIPSLKIRLRVSSLGVKVPYGSIGFSIIEDDWRAYKITVKLKTKYMGLVDYTWGPPIKIYSRSTGPDTTMVEIIADSAKLYDGTFINSLLDTIYKDIPIYSWYARLVYPAVYFEETRVYDGKRAKELSFEDEFGRTALNYVFQRIHQTTENKLRER